MCFSQVPDPQRRTILIQVLDDYCREHDISEASRARATAAERLEDIARSGMNRAEDLAIILRAMRG